MAYNESLAERIREKLSGVPEVEEKSMMGGLTFMVNGKMCVGIIKEDLMCRIDPNDQQMALNNKGCRIMDFNNKPMKGYIMIDESGTETENQLNYWLDLALSFNPKAKASKKRK